MLHKNQSYTPWLVSKIYFNKESLVMKLLMMAIVIFLGSCGVTVHPVPGVSLHIPVHHDTDQHRDSKSNDRD